MRKGKKDFQLLLNKTAFVAKEIGYVGVDAGMIMVGDPCYSIGSLDAQDKKKEHEIYGKDWNEFCDKFYDAKCKLQLPMGFGFCISTVEGDGFYNVYGVFAKSDSYQPKYLLVEL